MDAFAAEVEGRGAAPTDEELRGLSIDALRELAGRLDGARKSMGLLQLKSAARRALAGTGKRPKELWEMIDRLAEILGKRPDCAADTQLFPRNWEALSKLALTVRTLIVNADQMVQGAGDRALKMIDLNTRACRDTRDRAQHLIREQKTDPNQRADTRTAFSAAQHASGVHTGNQKAGRGRSQRKIAPMATALQGNLEQAADLRRIDRFMQGVKDAPPGFGADAAAPQAAARKTTKKPRPKVQKGTRTPPSKRKR